MKWKDKLINDVLLALEASSLSHNDLVEKIKHHKINVHLAIFAEPFYSLVLDGKKNIESRFSKKNVTPFRKVRSDDVVLIKQPGRQIQALFTVRDVRFISNLNLSKISSINEELGEQLCWDIDLEFLNTKSSAKFLTLIFVDEVILIPAVGDDKSDRTAWSILRLSLLDTLFEN